MNQFDRERFEKAKKERDADWLKVVEWSQQHRGKKVVITRKDHPYNGMKGTFKGVAKSENGAVIEIKLSFFKSCYVFSILDLKFIEHE